ncbi:MAG: hypothetical protein AAB740_04230 [Patescibacteria group bacterium]
MQNKKQIFAIVASVLATVFSVAIITKAVTTVGNDVSVGGALTVTGTSTLASTLYVNQATGRVGIGTTTPTRTLEVFNASNPQLRLSQANGKFFDIAATTTGDLIITSNLGVLLLTDTTNKNVFLGEQSSPSDVSIGAGGNVAIGYETLKSINNAGADYNTAVGFETLTVNTSGNRNTAVGAGALYANTTGYRNSAFGVDAMGSFVSGYSNDAFGRMALFSNISGIGNGAFGSEALYLSTGNSNTALGSGAGDNITTGSNNIIIGANIDVASTTGSYQLNIGNTIYGNLSTGLIGVGTTTPAYNLEVSSSASTTVMIGSGALTGCLGIGDTDKAGITWCTALDGTLSCSGTKPQQCK